MPNIIKIGYSTKDPKGRAIELGTGSPYAYEVEYEILVEGPEKIEKKIHNILSFLREGKEWFLCEVSIAIKAIQQACEGEKVYFESFTTEKSIQNKYKDYRPENSKELPILNDSKKNPIHSKKVTSDENPKFIFEKISEINCDISNEQNQEEKYELAVKYDTGNGAKKNIKEAFKIFLELAEKNHYSSLLAIGKAYLTGRGTDKDTVLGLEALRKVADHGEIPEALYLFAYNVMSLDFETEDRKLISLRKKWCGQKSSMSFALHYLIMAKDMGYAPAIDELGTYYSMQNEFQQAFELYRSAAQKGYPKGMRHLADCYYNGYGCPPNIKLAEKWYRLAAEAKDYTAKKKIERWEWYSQF